MPRERRHGERKPPTSSIHAGMRIAHVSGCGPTLRAHLHARDRGGARRRRAGDTRRSEATALLVIRSGGCRIMARIVSWCASYGGNPRPRRGNRARAIPPSRPCQGTVNDPLTGAVRHLSLGRGRAWQPTGGLAASGRWCRDLLSVSVRMSFSIGKDVLSCRCGFLVSADADLRSSGWWGSSVSTGAPAAGSPPFIGIVARCGQSREGRRTLDRSSAGLSLATRFRAVGRGRRRLPDQPSSRPASFMATPSEPSTLIWPSV